MASTVWGCAQPQLAWDPSRVGRQAVSGTGAIDLVVPGPRGKYRTSVSRRQRAYSAKPLGSTTPGAQPTSMAYSNQTAVELDPDGEGQDTISMAPDRQGDPYGRRDSAHDRQGATADHGSSWPVSCSPAAGSVLESISPPVASAPVRLFRRRSANDLLVSVAQREGDVGDAGTVPVLAAATVPSTGSDRSGLSLKVRLRLSVMEAQRRQKQQQAMDKDLLGASATGKLQTVLLLLGDADCNPNCTTRHGLTPLHYASIHGNVDIARALLAAGADPSLKTSKGFTPQDGARHNDQQAILELLEGKYAWGGPKADSGTVESSPREGGSGFKFFSVSVLPARLSGPFYWPHTEYTVTMTTRQRHADCCTFTVKRRFSDFYGMFKAMLPLCPSAELQDRLAALEPQKTFFHRFKKAVVDHRAEQFQKLLMEAANAGVPELVALIVDFFGDC